MREDQKTLEKYLIGSYYPLGAKSISWRVARMSLRLDIPVVMVAKRTSSQLVQFECILRLG